MFPKIFKKIRTFKQNPNYLLRDDKRLEDAIELDNVDEIAIFKKRDDELKEHLVFVERFERVENSRSYRMIYAMHVCPGIFPKHIQEEIHITNPPSYPNCFRGNIEKSCDTCIYGTFDFK